MAIVVRADKQASREPNNGVGRRVRITAKFLPLVSPFIPFFEVLREQQAPE